MTDLASLDATAQADLVRNGDAQPIELVDAAIARIELLNDELNAVIHPLFDRARTAVSATLPDGPFRGVPIVVKDLDGELAGAPYHCGNRLLKQLNYTPTVSSHLFAKLEAAGFVIVGKTNTPELGLMTTTEPLGTDRRATLGTPHERPAARAELPRPRSRVGWCHSHTRATAAGRSASRRACAGSSD